MSDTDPITAFQRIGSLADDVDRAQAYEALSATAIDRLVQGDSGGAVDTFVLLARLDDDDDFVRVVRSTAIAYLEALGERQRPDLDAIEQALLTRFAALPERARSIAVGTSLFRDHEHTRRDALARALVHFERADGLGALNPRERAPMFALQQALARPMPYESLRGVVPSP